MTVRCDRPHLLPLPLVATVAASIAGNGRPLCSWRLQVSAKWPTGQGPHDPASGTGGRTALPGHRGNMTAMILRRLGRQCFAECTDWNGAFNPDSAIWRAAAVSATAMAAW